MESQATGPACAVCQGLDLVVGSKCKSGLGAPEEPLAQELGQKGKSASAQQVVGLSVGRTGHCEQLGPSRSTAGEGFPEGREAQGGVSPGRHPHPEPQTPRETEA